MRFPTIYEKSKPVILCHHAVKYSLGPSKSVNLQHNTFHNLFEGSEYTGPTLGPKKNRSYESLQAMITENESSNTQRSLRKTSSRVARARGCNESFRAAVDRSYEPPQGGEHMMPGLYL